MGTRAQGIASISVKPAYRISLASFLPFDQVRWLWLVAYSYNLPGIVDNF